MSPQLGCTVLLLLAPLALPAASSPAGVSPPATRDQAIVAAGPAPLYLDGSDWTLTGAGRAWTSGECNFVEHRDYNPQGASAQVVIASSHYYMDRAACCRSCGATDGCAAAVFRNPTPCSPYANLCRGHCTFRTAEDLLSPVDNSTENVTSCIPTGLQPTPTITINATVPGDLVTDLQRAGVIADPLTDANFKNTTWWNGRRWSYSKSFAWPPPLPPPGQQEVGAADGGEVLLVMEGIKMGANVSLNGQYLGTVTDQFVRQVWPVSKLLAAQASGADVALKSHTIEVVFDREIGTNARFMACSGRKRLHLSHLCTKTDHTKTGSGQT
jgi:hypothetical protein